MASLPFSAPLLPSCLLLLALGAGCTRANLQEQGRYAFTAEEVFRDDCGLVPTPESLWDGDVDINGDVVRITSDWRGLRLIGFVLPGGFDDDDAFVVDGSESNAAISLQGRECLVDQISFHLEGTTQCANRFDGVLRVRLEPRVQQPGCACELWVKYRAVQNRGCE